MWIRIRIRIGTYQERDRHSGHADPDPADPDRVYVDINSKQNEKVDTADFFPEKFKMLSKILKTYETFNNDEKDNTL